jgi:PAS domain S-box-containing protein
VTGEFDWLQRLLDANDQPVYAFDRELRYTAFNSAHADVMRALFGAEIALGGRLADYQTVKADRETAQANLERALAGEHVVVSAFSGEPGRERYFDIVHDPLTDAAGTVIGVVVHAYDVSEAKVTEEEVSTILRTTMDGFYLVDKDGGFLDTNDAYCQMIGYSREALLQMSVRDIEAIDTQEDIEKRIQRIMETGHDRFETKHKRKDERVIDIEASVNLLKGDPEKLVVFMRDITERKQAEEELRASRRDLIEAQRLAGIGSWTYDPATGQPEWSEGMFRIWGLDPGRGAPSYAEHRKLIHPEDFQRFDDAVREAVEHGTPYAMDLRILRPDGDARTIITIGEALRDAAGNVTGLRGTTQDISGRKQAEEELLRHAEQLRRTVEGAVLAMSHMVESRDPYTAGHERRVAELTAAIGAEMGMAGEELTALRLAGTIHDIGKVAVPAEILSKPGRLSAMEFELIKQHSQVGFDILADVDFGRSVAEMVLQHHERLDGSGYPRALKGADILPEARILAVADVIEAMSSHRPYRAALGMEAALAEVREHAGAKYDAEVVASCVKLVEEQSFQFTP